MFREKIKKAKAQVELNLVRDVKNDTNGLFRYISQKRQAKGSVPPSDKWEGKTGFLGHGEGAEVLSKFFTLVFTGSPTSHASCVPEPLLRGHGSKTSLTVRAEQVQDQLRMCTSLWGQMACILEFWKNWLMCLPSCSPSSLKNCGYEVKSPVMGKGKHHSQF